MNIKPAVFMPILIEHDWQIPMTQCALQTLFVTTGVHFDLVVVETGSSYFSDFRCLNPERYFHINQPEKTTLVTDCNAAIDLCQQTGATHVVHTGNDVFVRPGWLEALIECFQIADCGVATLGNADLKHKQEDIIVEGVYGPFMMFPADMRFDERYNGQFGDTDLVMRQYEKGLRSYRNYRVVIQHLLRQTVGGPDNEREFAEAKEIFVKRHSISRHLLMYHYLCNGTVI